MSESESDPLRGLLSEFALGPAWARGGDKTGSRSQKLDSSSDESRPPRRDRDRDGRRPFQKRDRNFPPAPSRREDTPPATGVRVTIIPDQQAVHLISREVHQVARVYPLFDVARILLAERARCRAIFEIEESQPAFFSGKLDESLFLTREEAVRHLWQSDLRTELLDEETVEAEPPTGNFQSVARCGLSGEWLGPPNFHSYQTNLRRLHRERFSHLPFEFFSSKVHTERGEEAVNAWLETTKQKIRWRIKGGEEESWIEDRSEAERALSSHAFDKAFSETRRAEVSAAIPGKNLSPALLASLRVAGSHARKHPAILIPAVCRSLEAEHLPVFKRQGKLHTGPARPHALAPETVLAERPAAMVAWIRANKPAKLAGFWQALLPEGVTEPTTEYAADLFWLLNQGHILLYTDDTLIVQEPREPAPPKKAKQPKGGAVTTAPPATEAAPQENPDAEIDSAESPETPVLSESAETLLDAAIEATPESDSDTDSDTDFTPLEEVDSPSPEASSPPSSEISASEAEDPAAPSDNNFSDPDTKG